MGKHPYDMYYDKLLPALVSKVEEFRLLDYQTAETATLWRYLLSKKWKKTDEERPLSRLVGDILSVKPSDYMNFMQLAAFKTPGWGEPLSEQELASLFDPRKDQEVN
ncbi:post-transcriptional regulator [Domibacillus indicus]|uniref:post-transcriptional regulator n=1 Tax=Domibacillus indicus TaxID=1437523 RepID=UPI000617D45D|nr:post-transcriptional regulator [Domibacillus indicus]